MAYHQSVTLQTGENCPNAPMVDCDGVSKCDSVRREVFFYPRESRGRNGTEEKYGAVFLTEEVRFGRRTAGSYNESLCEDIIPPVKKRCPRK
jgi:hypothetical protein